MPCQYDRHASSGTPDQSVAAPVFVVNLLHLCHHTPCKTRSQRAVGIP
jgi:hypothetical protein